MTSYNFEASNLPGFFIRHRDFLGEMTEQWGPSEDFAFTLVNRGNGQVAFRSANFPDRYLRHRDYRVHLDAPAGPDDELFRLDSSFTRVPGLADRQGYSFRSANFPDRYLRHRDYHLWIEPPPDDEDELFRKDATFYQRPAAVRID